MLPSSPEMLFPFTSCDPDEISWQLSLGRTSLDRGENDAYAGMTAIEACLTMICEAHKAGSGRPSQREEKSLRLLVEDAIGDPSFQQEILPALVRKAIAYDNSAVVGILLSYAADQTQTLKLANARPGEVVGRVPSPSEASGRIVVNDGADSAEDSGGDDGKNV